MAIRFHGRGHRIDFKELTGRSITIYAQQEVVEDLIAARLKLGLGSPLKLRCECPDDFDSKEPRIRFGPRRESSEILRLHRRLRRVSRARRPTVAAALTVYQRSLPIRVAWHSGRGAAFVGRTDLRLSRTRVRSSQHAHARDHTVVFLQCAQYGIRRWSDEKIWSELQRRLNTGWNGVDRGPDSCRKASPECASFVVDPMQCGRSYLAGTQLTLRFPNRGQRALIWPWRMFAYWRMQLRIIYRSRNTQLLDHYTEDVCGEYGEDAALSRSG